VAKDGSREESVTIDCRPPSGHAVTVSAVRGADECRRKDEEVGTTCCSYAFHGMTLVCFEFVLCCLSMMWGSNISWAIVAPVLRHFYTEPKALCLLVRLGCLYGVDVPLLCNYSEDYNYMVCMHVVKVVRACTGEW